MSDEEASPNLDIKLDGQDFEMRRDNGMLYTFLGDLACYNHVFLTTGENEQGHQSGTYIFRATPGFNDLMKFMLKNNYPAQLNMPRVPECDQQAFDRCYFRDVRELESYPENWEQSDGEA